MTKSSHKTEIFGLLTEFCKANNVKCLFAVEHSSRVWGYANDKSDHDIMFVFVKNIDDYLSIYKNDGVLSLTTTLKDKTEITLVGWDIKKFTNLMDCSNPTALEMISILYSQKDFTYYDVGFKQSTTFLYPCFEEGTRYNRYTLVKAYHGCFIHHIKDYETAKQNKDNRKAAKHIIAACMNINLANIYINAPITRSYYMNYDSSTLESYMLSISKHNDYHSVLVDLKSNKLVNFGLMNNLYKLLTDSIITQKFDDKISGFDFKNAIYKIDRGVLNKACVDTIKSEQF